MQLLLIRHAIAEERTDFAVTGKNDAERPLTEYGRRRMAKNARGLRRVAPKVDVLVTSPYARARETARIVGNTLGIRTMTDVDALTPEHHPKEFFAWLASQGEDATVAAVGHEPNISRLMMWALSQDAEARSEFKKGGVALIEFEGLAEAGKGMLRWLLTPAQLRSIAD